MAALIVIMVVALIALCVVILLLVRGTGWKSKRLRQPVSRGEAGEHAVADILGETVPAEQYVINDYLFVDAEGHSRQVDHVYINGRGIWVIETKNYSGTVYGYEKQREWTQVSAGGKEVNRFYNPLKQNLTHIYSLAAIIGRKDIFHNVVCFVGSADISNVIADNVCGLDGIGYIKKRNAAVSLDAEEMASYYNRLLEWREEHPVSESEHVASIMRKREEIRQGVCPRCGGRLVVREGKYGEFFGCSNYPACTFRKKINEDV